MLHFHSLPLTLWAEAINTAVYLLNRTINTQVGMVTPYELWFHRKPSITHYCTFGTVAYIFTDKALRTKFQPKGHMVIFVGYSTTSKGWRFWNLVTNLVSEDSDMIFDETTGYSSSSFLPTQDLPVIIPPLLLTAAPSIPEATALV